MWYGEEASAISINMTKEKYSGVAASINVLSLDAGGRAMKILGDI